VILFIDMVFGARKKVVFNLPDWTLTKISLTTLDPNSVDNINQVKLLNTESKSNNLNDLPKEYRRLYSRETYDLLITGSIKSKNWARIKTEGFDTELHKLFSHIPDQKIIFCYLFTTKGDMSPKNFSLARIDGAQIQQEEEELKELAKYIRRMYTDLYTDLKELYTDSDKDFVEKLDKASKGKNAFCEWTVREYKSLKWFYNELPSDDFREVIFSSKNGSVLNSRYECKFPNYKPQSGEWPMPSMR